MSKLNRRDFLKVSAAAGASAALGLAVAAGRLVAELPCQI